MYRRHILKNLLLFFLVIFFTSSLSVTQEGIRKIYIIGDSTVATYRESDYPMTGWGQVLQLFFETDSIEVVNRAIGGRSSRSFWEEGRWDEVSALLDSNDYVFIQFGHNDRDFTKPERYTDTADYKDYLRIYVNETRERGATPVLVSPMVMNAWAGTTLRNVFTEGANDYRGAMLEVAEELDALFVDLNMKSHSFVSGLGMEYATHFVYMGLDRDEYPNYPDGRSDGTHFQEMGALEMARLVVEGISELSDDPDMSFLTERQTPTTSFTASLLPSTAGWVTIPGSLPVNAQVTMKARVRNSYTFDHWEDALDATVTGDLFFTFTLEDSVYQYAALAADCSGEVGGAAQIDDCGMCAGGNTGYPPCEFRFECEDACSYTGTRRYSSIGGRTSSVVNTGYSDEPPELIHSVEAASAGSYNFALIYHSVTEGEQLSVELNGEEVITGLDLVQSNEWDFARLQLDLDAGINMITFHSSADQGGILFDFLVYYSEDLSDGTCNTSIQESADPQHYTQVYPNPFSEDVTLTSEGPIEFRVFDAIGIEVLQGEGHGSIRMGSTLPEGLYLLQVTSEQGRSTQLIRKE
jgi:lysophospholipase L1-like esterase